MPDAAPLRTVTIRRSLLRSLVILLALLTGGILASTVWTAGRVRDATARALVDGALHRAQGEIRAFFGPVRRGLLVTRRLMAGGILAPEDDAALDGFFSPLLEEVPWISSANLADGRGRGYMLLRLDDRWRNRRVALDESDRHVYREWREGATLRTWTVESPEAEERYDPRTRPWYRVAHAAAARHEPEEALPDAIYWSEPYTFFTTGLPGITAMVHAADASGRRWVAAFDLRLRDLSDFVRELSPSEHGLVFLADEEGRLLGLPDLPALRDPRARAEAFLARPSELGIPILEDATRAITALGSEPPPIFPFTSGDERHWAAQRLHALGPNRELRIVVAVPESDLLGPIEAQRLWIGGVFGAGFAGAVALSMWLARRYGRPLAALAGNSRRIADLELAGLVPVRSHLSEVDQLARAQERMRAALDSFSRYVPVDVVRELLVRGEAARIGGQRRTVTSLFTDIEGFTTIAEALEPEAVTAHLADYFEALLRIVQGDGFGEVSQLTGDGVVAFWGAPLPDPDHAAHAVEAVCRCRERLEELGPEWQARGLPALPTRFGLATGPVTVGNVGATSRLVYTAIGDTINLASRLEGINRIYGTKVLAADSVRAAAGPAFAWRHVDAVRVKGRSTAVEIHELLGRTGEVPPETLAFARQYEEALHLHRARRFDDVLAALGALERERPGDPSVQRLRETATELRATPPPDDWDAVSNFYEK